MRRIASEGPRFSDVVLEHAELINDPANMPLLGKDLPDRPLAEAYKYIPFSVLGDYRCVGVCVCVGVEGQPTCLRVYGWALQSRVYTGLALLQHSQLLHALRRLPEPVLPVFLPVCIAVLLSVPLCCGACLLFPPAPRSDLEPNWVELPEMHPAVFLQGLKHRNWTHPEYK
jgi:hypothetical protein